MVCQSSLSLTKRRISGPENASREKGLGRFYGLKLAPGQS